MENLNTSERFSESFKQQTPIDNKEWAPQAQVQRFANRNWQIVELRLHFAHRGCQDFFAYREIRPGEKPSKNRQKKHKHKVLNFSVCAKKCGLRPENDAIM